MADVKTIRIVWWEPRWSFVPRELRDFQSSFRLKSWLRIIVVSAAIMAPIALLANVFIPGLQFNWLAALTISIAAIVGILLAFLILLVSIPPLVFVTKNGFGWWYPVLLFDGFTYLKHPELQSVKIIFREDGKHFLRIRTKRFCRRIGLSSHVNIDKLLELFGDSLIVKVHRQRSIVK